MAFAFAAIMISTGIVAIWLILRATPEGRGVGAWFGLAAAVLLIVTGVLFGALGTIVVTTMSSEAIRPTADELDTPAEDFAFRRVSDDREIRLAELQGRVVVLNIWATWCGPCIHEMPELNRLQAAYGQRGLMVVTLSDESPETILDFERDLPLASLSVYTDAPRRVPEPFRRGFNGRPSTYIIDRDGIIRHFLLGAHTFEEFERIIEPYLYEAADPAGV
jgi:cytochrome c biogenesis protein CcmG, thiol:disulfide interchange protein DsbE